MARPGAWVALALALLAGPAGAEIYRWVDAQGREHFTTRLEDVPPADRERARAEAAGRRSIQRAQPRSGAAPRPRPARKPWQVEEPEPEGRDETWWRDEHASRLDRVRELEARIAELEELGVTQPPAPRHVSNASSRRWHRYRSRWRERQRAESDLRSARGSLDRFEERARRAGVPPGWLRPR